MIFLRKGLYTYQAMCAPGTFPQERFAYLLGHVCTRNISSGKVCILTRPCVHQEHFLRKGLHTYQAMCTQECSSKKICTLTRSCVLKEYFPRKDLHTYKVMCAPGTFLQDRSINLPGHVCTRNVSLGNVLPSEVENCSICAWSSISRPSMSDVQSSL